jgi:uncharacterized RDD family membrane protein YckC
MNKHISAPIWRRLASLGYEMLFVLAILLTASFVAVIVVKEPLMYRLCFQLYLLFCLLGYFALSWHYYGQTIAMRAWHLRLLTFNNLPVSFGRCCLRFIVAFLSALLGGVGFLWAFVDKDHLFLHDRICRTKLVWLNAALPATATEKPPA